MPLGPNLPNVVIMYFDVSSVARREMEGNSQPMTQKSGDSGFDSRAGFESPVGPMVRRLTTELFFITPIWAQQSEHIFRLLNEY